MARKIKYSPKKQQPGLFDLTGDLFAGYPAEQPSDDALPPVEDFIVNRPSDASPRHTPSSAPRTDGIDEVDREQISSVSNEPIFFMSFGSGSSGNCSYVGDRSGGILIDAGIDPNKLRDDLRANGLNFDMIRGVCLTHDHSDHVRYVYTLVRKHPHIGVYCTPKTLSGMLRRHNISRRIKDYHRPIYKEFSFRLGNFDITAFEVSHDGTDNSGFFITNGTQSLALATDLGTITPRVDHYMRQASHIVIESNYDAEMLRTGRYPMYLKARIAADNGHLDNAVTGRFVAELATAAPERLHHVFLCHLSQDNNTPDTALLAVKEALAAMGIDAVGDASESLRSRACRIQLAVLPRFAASPLYTLRP